MSLLLLFGEGGIEILDEDGRDVAVDLRYVDLQAVHINVLGHIAGVAEIMVPRVLAMKYKYMSINGGGGAERAVPDGEISFPGTAIVHPEIDHVVRLYDRTLQE